MSTQMEAFLYLAVIGFGAFMALCGFLGMIGGFLGIIGGPLKIIATYGAISGLLLGFVVIFVLGFGGLVLFAIQVWDARNGR